MTNQNATTEEIYRAIKKRCSNREYVSGYALPPIQQLSKEFDAKPDVMAKALDQLVADGFLRQSSDGNFAVIDTGATQRLNMVTSTTETLLSKGYEVTTKGMHIKKVVASSHITNLLNMDPGSQVYKTQRVQCADGEPIAIITNYTHPQFVPGFEKHVNAFSSFYNFIEETYGVQISGATDYITAIPSSFEESLILQIPSGSPLLRNRRITHSGGEPFSYEVVKMIAEKYEYCIHLTGRSK